MRAFALVLVAVLPLCPASVEGGRHARTPMAVRLYDASGQSATERAAAVAVAADIVSTASLDVVWLMCPEVPQARASQPTTPSGDDRCGSPLSAGEFVLRIIPSPLPWRRSSTVELGQALLDARSGEGVLATVYIDRVEWRAAQAKVPMARLLGRAMAHELGHLLLARSEHAKDGLMRALWTKEELRAERPSDWMFKAAEWASIQAQARPVGSSAMLLGKPRR